MVQDDATTYVARALDYDNKTCDIHNGDKVGRSAIGELVRNYGRKMQSILSLEERMWWIYSESKPNILIQTTTIKQQLSVVSKYTTKQ